MKFFATSILLCFVGCASTEKPTNSGSIEKPSASPMAPKVSVPPATVIPLHKVSCTHGTDTRFLDVEKKANGCVLNYTKAGKISAVATASHGSKYCEATELKIRGKLEKGD